MNNTEEDRWQLPDTRERKSNSTATLFLNSTITSPNVNIMIQAVATVIHSQMLEDVGEGRQIDPSSDLFYFSEEKYILENPIAFDELRVALLRKAPTIANMFEFIKALFDCAQFSPECCIISLVYVNRLIAFTGMPLQTTNWRPILLCALLVSQKVWDDRYLSNADFSYIYPFFTIEEINKLEQKFLEALQYSVIVKPALYAKYYFELRGLFKESSSEFPLMPLDRQKAAELEGRSAHVSVIEANKTRRLSQTTVAKVGSTSYSVIN